MVKKFELVKTIFVGRGSLFMLQASTLDASPTSAWFALFCEPSHANDSRQHTPSPKRVICGAYKTSKSNGNAQFAFCRRSSMSGFWIQTTDRGGEDFDED